MEVDSSVEEERERRRLEEMESAVYYAIDKNDPRRLAQLLADGRVDANMSFSGTDSNNNNNNNNRTDGHHYY